jgi:hypothetical protein
MKLILDKPPAGYVKEAEYRELSRGDFWLDPMQDKVQGPCQSPENFKREKRIVLTLSTPTARYSVWSGVDQVPTSCWYRRRIEPNIVYQITGLNFTDSLAFFSGYSGWVSLPLLFKEWERSYTPDPAATWETCGKDEDIPF